MSFFTNGISNIASGISSAISGIYNQGLSWFIPTPTEIFNAIDFITYPLQVIFTDIASGIFNAFNSIVLAILDPTGNSTSPLANATVHIIDQGLSGGWEVIQTEILPFIDTAIDEYKDTGELSLLVSGPLTALQTAYHALTFFGILEDHSDLCPKKQQKNNKDDSSGGGLFSIL